LEILKNSNFDLSYHWRDSTQDASSEERTTETRTKQRHSSKENCKNSNLKFSQFFVVVIVGSSGKYFCLRFVCWINNTNYERFLLSFSEEEEKKFLFVLRYQMMSFMQSWIHRRYFLKKIKCKTLINKKLKMRRMQNLLTSKTFTKGFILLNLL
jgi:hypothetical protein